jgi:hypothetical protein
MNAPTLCMLAGTVQPSIPHWLVSHSSANTSKYRFYRAWDKTTMVYAVTRNSRPDVTVYKETHQSIMGGIEPLGREFTSRPEVGVGVSYG